MKKRMAKKLMACMLSVSMALGGVSAGAPNKTQAAAKKPVTVTAQTELNQALKDSKVTKITVKTKKAVSLTVKKGSYQDKTLVLSGEKITLKNAGSFQKISIQDAKQFTEKAENNTISVTDPNTLKLTAAKNAKVSEVKLNSSSQKVVIAANGQVKSVSVNKTSNCVLKGTTKKTVTVNVAAAAKGSAIKTAVPSALKLKANATVTAAAGAEGAVIETRNASAKVSVINHSGGDITIVDAEGNRRILESGEHASNAVASSSQKKVTFALNYDAAGTYKTVSVTSGEKVAQPENPMRIGYSFDGWYTASEGGEKFDFDMAIAADLTLYAQWKAEAPASSQNKVTFEWNYGSAGTYQTLSVNSGEKVQQPANPKRSGYIFNGWYTSANGGERFNFHTEITADVVLYAHWSYSSSTGGSSIGSGGSTGGSGIGSGGSTGGNGTGSGGSTEGSGTGSGGNTEGSGTGSGGNTEGSGTESGGNTEGSGTGSGSTGGNGSGAGNPGSDNSDPSETSYSVRFYLNDGSDTVYHTVSVVSGNTIAKPADPEREGYAFEGWYKSSDLTMHYDFTSAVTRDTGLYAKWKKNATNVSSNNVKIGISEYCETVTEMKQALQGTMYGATDVLWTISDESGTYSECKKAFVDQTNHQWNIWNIQLHPGKNTIKVKAVDTNGNSAELDDIIIFYDHGEMQPYTEEDITYFKDESGNDKKEGYINNVILVTLKNKSEDKDREKVREEYEEALASVCEAVNGEVVGQINGALMYQIRLNVDQEQVAADSDHFENLEGICKAAEEASGLVGNASCDLVLPQNDPEELDEVSQNSIYQLRELLQNTRVPNDPWLSDQDWDEEHPGGLNWWAEAVCAPSAWAYENYFREIPIGIVDSGIKEGHEDLPGFYTVSEANVAASHGTHVAGIIGAKDNNGKGITGMVWKKNLYNYDAYEGATTTSRIANGITRLVESGCKVINNSNGGKYSSVAAAAGSAKNAELVVMNLCARVREDFLIVCSAGNDAWDSRRNGSFSAVESGEALDHIIVVAAADMPVGEEYKLTWFSNYGDYVTVAAPGAYICSTIDSGSGYGLKNGTSMAAPIVTGIASLVWSVNEYMTAKEVKQIIVDTSRKGVVKAYYDKDGRSYDLVNAASAVERAIGQTCGNGDVEGRFVDAVTGNGVPGVSYKVHMGTNDGEVICEYTADGDGKFLFSLPASEYVIEAYGNFVTSYTPVTIVANRSAELGDIPLTSALESNTYRVVLEWGQYPYDLDSHINANKSDSGERLHVFYGHKVEDRVDLDRDDVDSYGPETITVHNFSELDGFTYSVHNFTHRSAQSGNPGAFSGEGSLANSGATVKLYAGDTLLATYKVPENQAGTVWNVFQINAEGKITTLNTFDYIADPRAVGAGFVNPDASDSIQDVDIEKNDENISQAAEGIDQADAPESSDAAEETDPVSEPESAGAAEEMDQAGAPESGSDAAEGTGTVSEPEGSGAAGEMDQAGIPESGGDATEGTDPVSEPVGSGAAEGIDQAAESAGDADEMPDDADI
ncbi:MAG: InlB B-repeat-containing protein [Eubacterium sp.]|nr:InlB B-repeat-containing protein [Eubacterium sp.]